MENTLITALSRQTALRRQMDVVANNIANMNTVGFKQSRIQFNEYLKETSKDDQLSLTYDRAVYRDTSNGGLTSTQNQLDVAIQGDGYFAVESDAGIHYTRNGRFRLDGDRNLITSSGHKVLSNGGQPINIPQNVTYIHIDKEAQITTNFGQLDKIKLVTFENEQDMEILGNNLLRTEQVEMEAEGSTVHQYMVEESNVKPILEMTNMIEIMRSYQSTQKLIDSENERQQSAINKLAKVEA